MRFRKDKDSTIKNFKNATPPQQPLTGELEGTVQGHRDGHGFLMPDDGQPDVYLSSPEMHAVMHGDRLRVRVVRQDKRGRSEGRVLEILERRKKPIIGRLLLESGL